MGAHPEMTPTADAPESETDNHNIQLFRIIKRLYIVAPFSNSGMSSLRRYF